MLSFLNDPVGDGDPEAAKQLAADGLVAVASPPDQFSSFVQAEIAEWSKLIKAMKL